MFTTPKPGIVVIVSSGPGNAVIDAAIMAEMTNQTQLAGSLKVFADLSDLTRMASETRERALAWGRQHRAQLEVAHLLVRSKLVEMALSVMGMLLGGGLLKLHHDSEQFYALLRSEVPGFELPESIAAQVV